MKARIREIMKERGVTYIMLAEKLGRQPASVSMSLTHGITGMAKIVQIAEILGSPVWEMFVEPEVKCQDRVTGQSAKHRIADILREKGLTQQDIASQVGISAATLSRNMNNPNATIQSLEAIANALHVPLYQLFISEADYQKEMQRRLSVNNSQPAVSDNPTVTPFPDDLFSQTGQEEEDNLPTITDGTYRYGDMVITLCDGKLTIA